MGACMEGPDLIKWRKAMNLTQQDAAEKLGVNRGTLADYERGLRRSDKKSIQIPKAIELACQSIKIGFDSYSDENAFCLRESEIPEFIQWSFDKLSRPEAEILREARTSFPDDWNSHPFAFVPHRKYLSAQAQADLREEMGNHGIHIEWRILPVAGNERGWKLSSPVIVAEDMDALFWLAMKFRQPSDV